MDALCLDFLNSEWHDFRGRWIQDRLQKQEFLTALQERWNLNIGQPSDAHTLEELTRLRAIMTHIVASLTDGPPPEEDLSEFNQFLHHVSLLPHLSWNVEGYRMDLIPSEKNWQWVMAEIAMSFADLLSQGDIRRIKICENAHCHWFFYDESKSRTRRYCSSEKCGNLLKLRRFRQRHRAAQAES